MSSMNAEMGEDISTAGVKLRLLWVFTDIAFEDFWEPWSPMENFRFSLAASDRVGMICR